MRYIVTKEIKSETKVVWILYFRDACFLAAWIYLAFFTKSRVHETLQPFYVGFAIILGIGLILPSRMNPKRRIYQSVALKYLRPKAVFRFCEKGKEEHESDGAEQKTAKKHKRRNTLSQVR